MNISHKSSKKSQYYSLWRDQQLAAGFEWNGARFQIDGESQRFIAAKALGLVKRELRGNNRDTITWRTQDNQFYTFEPDEFLDFAEAVEAYVENVLVQVWAGKDAL